MSGRLFDLVFTVDVSRVGAVCVTGPFVKRCWRPLAVWYSDAKMRN